MSNLYAVSIVTTFIPDRAVIRLDTLENYVNLEPPDYGVDASIAMAVMAICRSCFPPDAAICRDVMPISEEEVLISVRIPSLEVQPPVSEFRLMAMAVMDIWVVRVAMQHLLCECRWLWASSPCPC